MVLVVLVVLVVLLVLLVVLVALLLLVVVLVVVLLCVIASKRVRMNKAKSRYICAWSHTSASSSRTTAAADTSTSGAVIFRKHVVSEPKVCSQPCTVLHSRTPSEKFDSTTPSC